MYVNCTNTFRARFTQKIWTGILGSKGTLRSLRQVSIRRMSRKGLCRICQFGRRGYRRLWPFYWKMEWLPTGFYGWPAKRWFKYFRWNTVPYDPFCLKRDGVSYWILWEGHRPVQEHANCHRIKWKKLNHSKSIWISFGPYIVIRCHLVHNLVMEGVASLRPPSCFPCCSCLFKLFAGKEAYKTKSTKKGEVKEKTKPPHTVMVAWVEGHGWRSQRKISKCKRRPRHKVFLAWVNFLKVGRRVLPSLQS